jgi:hypothetical protein
MPCSTATATGRAPAAVGRRRALLTPLLAFPAGQFALDALPDHVESRFIVRPHGVQSRKHLVGHRQGQPDRP